MTTKVSRCRFIVTHMATIPVLSAPPIPLGTLTSAITALEDAHNLSQTGNKAAIVLVHTRSAELNIMMRTTRDYVTLATDGDGALIVQAGFDLVRIPTPIGNLPAPSGLKQKNTDNAGQAELRWGRVNGASSYKVEYRPEILPSLGDGTDPTNPWQTGPLVQAANAKITGLRSAAYYLVRVAANGTNGLSGWCDPLRVLVK